MIVSSALVTSATALTSEAAGVIAFSSSPAIGVQLALIAVLALGLGALIRRSAGTLTVLFVLLLVLPPVLQQLAELLGAGFLATAADHTPALAGDRFMAGELGFGLVLAAWAAGAVAAAIWALRTRDA